MKKRYAVVALVLVLSLTGCFRGEDTVKSIILWSPESLQVGRTVRLKAAGVCSDGIQRTFGIQWSLSNEEIAKINEKGDLTTLKPGILMIQAEKDGVRTQRPLLVIDVFDGVKIHYRKPPDWQEPNIYAFDEFGARAEQYTGEWPGTKMEPEGNDWFVYTLPGKNGSKAIFNDGNRQNPRPQSPGFQLKKGEWWYEGAWYAADPIWEEQGWAEGGESDSLNNPSSRLESVRFGSR